MKGENAVAEKGGIIIPALDLCGLTQEDQAIEEVIANFLKVHSGTWVHIITESVSGVQRLAVENWLIQHEMEFQTTSPGSFLVHGSSRIVTSESEQPNDTKDMLQPRDDEVIAEHVLVKLPQKNVIHDVNDHVAGSEEAKAHGEKLQQASNAAGTARSDTTDEDWIELRDCKQWSRLLYTNPVCFLSTAASDVDVDDNNDNDSDSSNNIHASEPSSSAAEITSSSKLARNVMVLSWLTATNNTGGFMFSINKRRYSAARILLVECDDDDNEDNNKDNEGENKGRFCLSVPTSDLEELVCQVGSVSGVWGISKFPDDHPPQQQQQQQQEHEGEETGTTTSRVHHDDAQGILLQQKMTTSKRTIKKQKGPRFPRGIPGLRAVALGHASCDSAAVPREEEEKEEGANKCASSSSSSSSPSLSRLFAIQGTVAHLQCRMIQHHEHMIDDEHYLVLAQVERAWVRSDYWDASKNLFCPVTVKSMQSPYLTFFGSQTFGYVVTKETLRGRAERQFY